MSTSKKYAMLNGDGEFIAVYSRTTHTGFHVHVTSTTDIEKASTFQQPVLENRMMKSVEGAYPIIRWVPVQETRTVEILGFGIST